MTHSKKCVNTSSNTLENPSDSTPSFAVSQPNTNNKEFLSFNSPPTPSITSLTSWNYKNPLNSKSLSYNSCATKNTSKSDTPFLATSSTSLTHFTCLKPCPFSPLSTSLRFLKRSTQTKNSALFPFFASSSSIADFQSTSRGQTGTEDLWERPKFTMLLSMHSRVC